MKQEIQNQIKIAMKAGKKIEVQTLRALLSAIQYEEMQKGLESLAENDLIAILKNETKKRREALEFAEKASREDQKTELLTELACIESFLPKQLTADEVEKVLTDFKNTNPSGNMGLAMKALKDNYTGQYDGKLASELAKKIFG
jgi:uncharacterized protein YqeY